EKSLEFLAWETLPHERLSPKGDTVTKRIKALHQVKERKAKIVITSIRGLLQPISKSVLESKPISLKSGLEIPMEKLLANLVYFGFTRTDLVERRGDFAVRGGIVDVFPTDLEHPIRLDYFGDEIDEISYFTVSDQRTTDPIDTVTIFPMRELLIDENVKKKSEYLAAEFPEISELATKISEGIYAEGMESLVGALKDDLTSLIDLLPDSYQVITLDEARTISRATDLVSTNKEFFEASWSSAALGGAAPIDLGVGYFDYNDLKAKQKGWLAINPYGSESAASYSDFKVTNNYGGIADNLIKDIGAWHAKKYRVIFTSGGRGIIERYQDLFKEAGLTGIEFQVSALEHGFINDQLKLAVITEKDASGLKSNDKDQPRMPSRRKKAIDPIELKIGDYVVHEQHGVGKYIELLQRTMNGVAREYLVIEYAPAKRGQPGDRKRKARKAVKQIAAELIQLYAARMSAPGFAFSPDNAWQRELESAFAYVETADGI
ncbi:MAG: hypothetical protein RL129_447, partial [Actinomycetota bacterium]